MSTAEGRTFVGKRCAITWADRSEDRYTNLGGIRTTKFVPVYGLSPVTEAEKACPDKAAGARPQ